MAVNADKTSTMMLDTLEAVPIDGVTQRMWIRKRDTANPMPVLVQQGPGLPMSKEVRTFERTQHLQLGRVLATACSSGRIATLQVMERKLARSTST